MDAQTTATLTCKNGVYSIGKAIFFSSLIAAIPTFLVTYINNNLVPLGLLGQIIAVIAFVSTFGTVFSSGWATPAQPGSIAVCAFMSGITHDIYIGQPWGIPALETFYYVVMQYLKQTVPKFETRTLDATQVETTGYFSLAVTNPFLTYRYPHPDQLVKDRYVASVNRFINRWSTSLFLNSHEQLLSDYLDLDPDPDHKSLAHMKMRAALMVFTHPIDGQENFAVPGITADTRALQPIGVDAIMACAGQLKEFAISRGLLVERPTVEKFDYSSKIENESDKVRAYLIESKTRIQIAHSFMEAAHGATPMSLADALNYADRQMNMGVRTNLDQIDLKNPAEIAQLIKEIGVGRAQELLGHVQDRTQTT